MSSTVSLPVSSASVSHEPANSNNSLICRYYVRGICRFGDLCRFIHTDPATITTTTTTSPSDGAATGIVTSFEQNMAIGKKSTDPNKWVLAPVFVPRQQLKEPAINSGDNIMFSDFATVSASAATADLSNSNNTYASIVMMGNGNSSTTQGFINDPLAAAAAAARVMICPDQYNCPHGELCRFEHNDLCEMCGRYTLHPTDKKQRKAHVTMCIQQHEKDMELSFAVARSKDKTCGICFEIILEKAGRGQRFGILPNCNHIFCLECIRKWRQAKQFDNKIIRACPECRIPSDYVCPSAFWVESKDEKEKLITNYKSALGEKDCKYFKKGEGKCPFGNKCFYKHALPGGERVDVGVPKRNKRKIQRAEDEILDLFDLYLWDFVDRRDFRWFEYIQDLSDSGDSDWSEDFD